IHAPTYKDYLLLILLSAIWGSAFVAIEFSVSTMPPFIIAFGRIFLASLFLLFFVFIKKLSFPKDMKTWRMLIIIGVLNTAAPFYLISWGQQYISAGTASVMLAVGPFVALLISHFLTNDEKFTIFKLIGVILGFIGVFILLGDDFLHGNQNSLYGKIAMLFAVSGYIVSGFLIRKVSHVPTLVCSSSMFITASILMFPFLFFTPLHNVEILSYPFLAIIYLAIVPTAAASLIRINLVQQVGVQFMSQVAYLIPMFAIFWAWVFFDDTPKQIIIITLILILSGLFIRNIKWKS
ncbi:MAG: DMT family transporter, partial [Campylobacterota bacterium]|nr:DMT family transporter [Campylobacterota bacterium]